MEKSAWIMDIKHFAIHDGDGIRTTVFFKGCPLKCKWCHNPEGLYMYPTLSYVEKNCINCGECVDICPQNAHNINRNMHHYDRSECIGCGKCAEVCLGEALRLYGKKMTVNELLPQLVSDKKLYQSSGGGVTLSGGECLMQWEFCKELLAALKKENIQTAVDTCGYVNRDVFDEIIEYTDMFLYDLKAVDEEIHKKAAGVSNKIILDNLKYLDDHGASIEMRIPYVPEYNADEIEKMAVLLSEMKNILKIRLLPFHNLAVSKYEAMGIECHMPQILPTKEDMNHAKNIFLRYHLPVED